MTGDIILSTKGLTKHYGGVHALDDADFEIREGEHVAIVGDNGAGKSTFVRQITGVEQPTAGEIYFDGAEHQFASPLDARKAGIETVFQNLALADDLDVPANIFLGREEVYFNLGPFSFLNENFPVGLLEPVGFASALGSFLCVSFPNKGFTVHGRDMSAP